VFDDEVIFNSYVEEYENNDKLKEKNIILTMIIFNLVADSRLEKSFSMEDLIKILTTSSLTPHEGKIIDVYLKIYRQFFSDEEKIKNISSELKNKIKNEISLLEDIFNFDN
jgi:predicted phage-related endonuclease